MYNNSTKITKLEGNTIIVRRSSDEKTDEDTNQETQKKEKGISQHHSSSLKQLNQKKGESERC